MTDKVPQKPKTAIKLKEFSTESLECFQEYGINAAEKLNQYSMQLEDALAESLEEINKLKKKIEEQKLEIKNLRAIKIMVDDSQDQN